MTYEEKTKRVEAIAAALDAGRQPLDQALELFDEGLRLLGEVTEQLHSMETRARELVARASGKFELVDMDRTNAGS